jgi:hypothetical protein
MCLKRLVNCCGIEYKEFELLIIFALRKDKNSYKIKSSYDNFILKRTTGSSG